jgi:hypothetical protein
MSFLTEITSLHSIFQQLMIEFYYNFIQKKTKINDVLKVRFEEEKRI